MRSSIFFYLVMAPLFAIVATLETVALDAHAIREGQQGVITSVPRTMSYQGYLKDNSSQPVTDTLAITFRIYGTEFGGTAIWTELINSVSIINGNFTAILGQSSPLNLSFDSEYWLTLQIDGDVEMGPRLKLQMNPYAARADTADYAMISPPDDDWIISSNNQYSAVTGNVGIGITTPAVKLDVVGDMKISGKAKIGPNNDNTGANSFVAGANNTSGGQASVVSGGSQNIAQGALGAIGGGNSNLAQDTAATVGGGRNNRARGIYSTIAGGGGATPADSNSANGNYAVVGGGKTNAASGMYSSISGGAGNDATGQSSNVAGGQGNDVSGNISSIGGGLGNNISSFYSAIGGGYQNEITAHYGAITGGYRNQVTSNVGFIGGGTDNTAGGYVSAIGGGRYNTASGPGATIPGGDSNSAAGDFSFAAGKRAGANHSNSFVWSDGTAGFFNSTGNRQFLIQAGGGVGIGTNAPTASLDVQGSIKSRSTGYIFPDGTVQQSAAISIPVGGVVAWLRNYPNTPPLPPEYVECNGSLISDPDSPFNGQTSPMLNNSPTFLVGSGVSGGTGGSATHTHDITMGGNAVASVPPTDYCVHQGTYTTDASSNMPPFYSVVWIMRIK